MGGNLIWMRQDDRGDTRFDRVPISLPGPGLTNHDETLVIRTLDVPAASVRIVELPKQGSREGFHPAPRRQFVIVLQGSMVVTSTNGESRRLGPGDCLLADDVDGRGHNVEDVGDENLVTFQIALPTDWQWPGHR